LEASLSARCGAAANWFAFAHSIRCMGRPCRWPSTDAHSFRAVAGRHVGFGVHSAYGQDVDRRRLSDRHYIWIFERMRGGLVFSRHSAGVILVSAVAPGHGAGGIWRNRQSGTGHFHAAATGKNRAWNLAIKQIRNNACPAVRLFRPCLQLSSAG
jgi:hypothetical protein